MAQVEIYDTTLRDGTQGLAFTLTSEDKVAIAKRLDSFGVDYIEGGWPGSNPKDATFFNMMKDVRLVRAKLAAFSMTRRKNTPVENDVNMKALLEAETPVATIVGKSWTLHVTDALGTTLDENLAMIQDSVAYMKAQGKTVIYDAEHFFDGYRADREYALATLTAAASGGADCIVLCDTNGGSMPTDIVRVLQTSQTRVQTPLGIHTHNDCEMAVANTLAAVQAGAMHVQGTINGYGERCGNANLISIIPNLALKLGYDQPQDLRALRDLSHYIDERANLQPNTRAAYVSDAAFAHKGGMHVSAVNKNPDTYEHVHPERVGNQRRILLSDLSGRANVLAKSDDHEASDPNLQANMQAVVTKLKELENRGYAFEGAEASFKLMSQKVRGEYQPYFLLHGFNINITKRDNDPRPVAEATIKVGVGDQLEHTAANGDGPVNALDKALRKALVRFYPMLQELSLVDYKVRVLSGLESGTASVVRVLVETSDGQDTWGTVGASTDVIAASYEALTDAIEYKLLKDKVKPEILTSIDMTVQS
ncbi:MAG: citramalate synthase [Deinococcota bacterium]